MRAHTTASLKPAIATPAVRVAERRCACGNHTVAGDECRQCREQRITLQRWSASRPVSAPLSPPASPALAAAFGRDLSGVRLRAGRPLVQAAPLDTAAPVEPTTEADTAETPTVEPTAQEPASPAALPAGDTGDQPVSPTVAPAFLVDDQVSQLEPGQMHKSSFLAQLRPAICAAADEALAPTGRSSDGCPYLDFWLDYYAQQDAAHAERALRRYAPEAASAASAADYLPIVAQRVFTGVSRWATTGQITGIPEGIPLALPTSAPAAPAIQPMAQPGGAHTPLNPQTIQTQLGQGQPLDTRLRSQMESAFGASFGHVQVHHDAAAAALASQVNARAFTVGNHVAFAPGEYQPNSLIGQVLVAHELAHVVQQAGASEGSAAMSLGDATYNSLEADADQAAVGVVTSLWGGAKGVMAGVVRNAIPSLRSGLRLQRCKSDSTPASSSGSAPSSASGSSSTPSPACSAANQSQQATASIQPVVVANDDGSSPTAAAPLSALSTIWSKCCINFNIQSTSTVNATNLKTLDIRPPVGGSATAEETALFTAAGTTNGIQIISVDQFYRDGVTGKNVAGGGKTYDAGTAHPRIVVVTGVVPEVVAHEVGHAMGYMGHDSNATVMQPTGAHDAPNPTAVSTDVCTRARSGSVLTVSTTSCCQNPT
jgi:hypothetical protein